MTSDWRAAKKQHWGAPVPGHLKHGQTTWACKVYGCDCKLCLPTGRRNRPRGQAKTPVERDREYRHRKRGQPVPPGRKHGAWTYRSYKCRCAVCVAGNAALRKATAERWRERARGRWVDGKTLTVICWPPKNAGPEWSCPDPHHLEAL